MAYQKKSIDALSSFIPEGSYPLVQAYLVQYRIALTITKSRKSKYGDYYFDRVEKRHKVSVNGNLNVYEFLITLLHEIAHLVTFAQYQNKVSAHGKEWKHAFGEILHPFIKNSIFPEDIKAAILLHLNNVKASHCRDEYLVKALQSYNENPIFYVSDIGIGNIFQIESGDIFKVLEKLRTRYKCMSLKNEKVYIFPAMYPVIPLSDPS